MRIKLLLFFLALSTCCISQDTIPISKIDTLINFFDQNQLRLSPYNNRVVPFDSYHPVYVLINYKDGKNKHLEYFRFDSLSYLVYEFYKSAKGSSNEGLKSSGMMRITNEIIGTSTTGVIHMGTSLHRRSRQIHYYYALHKEGEWFEYQDSIFHHIYWTGKYLKNKRIGIWKQSVYGIADEFTLKEVNYDRDSTKVIYSVNIITTIPIDSINKKLIGRWSLRSCDEEKSPRMFYSKCQTYDGIFGDDCNNKWARENYFDFISSTKFIRQRGEGCYKFRESCTSGQWKIIEHNGQRYIEMKFTNGQTWKLNVLYLDNENNLITDRQ